MTLKKEKRTQFRRCLKHTTKQKKGRNNQTTGFYQHEYKVRK